MIIGLVALAAIYGLAVAALFMKQRAFIYPAPIQRFAAADIGAAFTDITLITTDGLKLHAVYRLARDGRRTLVFFHGNGDNLEGAFAAVRDLPSGYGLLLVEYRGYAGNPGTPDEAGLYQDGRAAMAWLAAHGIAPDRIVLIGNSVGGGIATQMASEFPVAGLALVSAFTTLPDVVAAKLWMVPVRSLLKDRYDNLSKVQRLMMPVLVLHGDADDLIPVTHGAALAGAAANATLVRVPGAGHELAYRPQSAAAIAHWLDGLPPVRSAP